MKQKYVWIAFIAVLVLGISTFIGCDDDSHDVVRFVGKAVYSGTSDPFVDIPVKVTDGQNTHCQTTTDAGGQFTLTVRISDIDGAYYLLAGDSTCVPKRVTLGGFGRMEVDLGSIEVEGPSLPIVETKPVSAIAASSATCGGNVTNDGRLTILARGVCWSTSEEPMIEDSHTTNGTGKGEFQTKITGLERNTTYYVRAYATNNKGTAYGNQVTFATTTGLPTVTTADISNITATTAKCGGEVLDNGGFTVTARGICWNTMGNPDINELTKTPNGNGQGSFSSNMTGLTPNTTYYVRAYATNEKGTNYGEEKQFKTRDGAAIVTTGPITDIKAISAMGNVTVTDAGGTTLLSCGICWSTNNPSPTTEDNTQEASGKAVNISYPCNMIGLSPNTTYYVRAYATTDMKTTYGEMKSFKTADGLPIVETLDPGDNVTTNSVSTGGNIKDDGGFPILECGVVYNTLPWPTLENSTKEQANNITTGYFSVTITGITFNTNYYVRAYATNAQGTAYGDPIMITSEYSALQTMKYGGYTYKIKFMGELTWTNGKSACSNMALGGFKDWYMPNSAETQAIITAYGLWGKTSTATDGYKQLLMDGCRTIWTSQEYNSSRAYYYYIVDSDNSSKYLWKWTFYSDTYKSNVGGVYAVRKYQN